MLCFLRISSALLGMVFALLGEKYYILEVRSMSDTTSCTTTPQLLKEAEVARLLKVGRRTLAYWRARRQGPPWVDVTEGKGRKPCIRYSVDALQKWIQANTKQTT